MSELVRPGPEFARLFHAFEKSAWRWEAQGTYNEPYESKPWQRWRDGEPDDYEWMRPWLDDIRRATAAGRRFERVRMQTDPLTDYLRWQAEVTPLNVEAGEDIRVLAEQRARELRLPEYDFWLFDNSKVAVLHFGGAGLEVAEIISAREAVDRHQAWRDLAWAHATPFGNHNIE